MKLLNRRQFLAGTALLGASLSTRCARPREEAQGPVRAKDPAARFTTITYNARHLEGWGARKGYEARLAAARPQFPKRLAVELARYAPDVVTLMEAPAKDAVAHVAERLGMRYFHYAEGAPGAVLTRCPVLDAKDRPGPDGGPCPESLRGRHFARTVLETAFGPIVIYSAHTTALNKERRDSEIGAMIEVMRGDIEAGGSLIFQGDLNHASQWPEYREWKRAGLMDAFAMKGTGVACTQGTSKPFLRLDYIWLHGPIAERLTECRVLFEGAFRTYPDDPATFTFSDHLPVMARFA